MRLAVYTDYLYHRVDGQVHAERAFALFLAELAERLESLVLVGRLHPGGGSARYPLGGIELVALPYYESLAKPLEAVRAMSGSVGRFWRALDEVDAVWLLGPHPLAFVFAAIALARRRKVILGVRQEFIEYVSSRHPGRWAFRAAATAMELGFRALGRFFPVVVVGPKLAHSYRHSRALLEMVVSVVPEAEVVGAAESLGARDYSGEVSVLSVGRLDSEKNPLALADTLELLNASEPRWRLTVCGEGPMSDALRERLAAGGQASRSELLGYVTHPELRELYLGSDLLLHVSWTEGVPQVLFEAFAAGLPVVATDVGGVRQTASGAAVLIAPGDPAAAAAALTELARDDQLRSSLVDRGLAIALANSMESQTRRVAAFISGSDVG
jgi:glycosyltransferase involved in cell wall biosynthesis